VPRCYRLSIAAAMLWTLALTTPSLLAAAGEDDPERWLTYKELRGSLRAGGAGSQGEMGLWTDVSSNVEIEGNFVLERKEISTYFGQVEFRGRLVGKVGYRSSMQGVKAEDFDSNLASVCSSDIGEDGEVKLVVDYKDGKYTLSASAPGTCNANRIRIEAQGQVTEADMDEVLANVFLPVEVLLGGGLPLPTSGKSITASVPVLLQAGLTPPVQGVGQWWIESDPAETEVSVQPDASYDEWIPVGNVGQPEAPAAWLKIKVKVYRKDDPDTLVPATLRFTLQRVSRERGVCLNWPPGDANTDPDLRLKFEDSQLGVPADDGTSIQTNRPVKELVLIVDAYDFGAWGTLQVSGTDVNNRAVAVKVRGKQSNELYIPLDEDQNHVADAWRPADAKGKRSDADDEHQEGNTHDGDGLTLYEEYRGFVEAGEPRKGDPAKKDFFIQNRIGALAIPGIVKFEGATELAVHHRFTEQELDWERVINRYSSSGRKQHGVVLALHQPGADPGYSEAMGGPGPPAKVSPILITPKKTPIDYEVAHELLHACNVAHHGETDKEVWWVAAIQQGVLTEEDCGSTSRITAFTENNEPLDWGRMRERGPLQVLMPAQHGQVSGEEECLMRYVYGGSVARIDSKDPKVRRLTSSGEIGTKLCRSGAGTGINATNIGWGNATNGRGNCFGQIHVNDAVPAEARTPLKQECN